MRNSLLLALVFVLACIIADFLGAVGYMIYVDCMCFNLGTSLEFLNLNAFVNGLVFSLPFAAIFSLIIVLFYVVKHPFNRWVVFTSYCVISLIAWVVIIPLSFNLEKLISKDDYAQDTKAYLSPNYFRDTEDGTYFIKSIDENNKTSGILIRSGKVYLFSDVDIFDIFQRKENTSSLHDPLLSQSLKPSGTISLAFYIFALFRENASNAFNEKGLYLFSLISMALALTSIYGFSKISKWRLCNISLIIFALIIISFVNVGIYSSSIAEKFIVFCKHKEWNFFTDRRILQILINSLFIINNIVLGIVKAVKNPSANCEVQE